MTSAEEGTDLLAMSHGVAILLLVLYLGYLVFQMWSHAVSRPSLSHAQCAFMQSDLLEQNLYTDDDVSSSTKYPAEVRDAVHEKLNLRRRMRYRRNRNKGAIDEEEQAGETSSSGTGTGTAEAETGTVPGPRRVEEDEDEEEEPQMSILATVVRRFPFWPAMALWLLE